MIGLPLSIRSFRFTRRPQLDFYITTAISLFHFTISALSTFALHPVLLAYHYIRGTTAAEFISENLSANENHEKK